MQGCLFFIQRVVTSRDLPDKVEISDPVDDFSMKIMNKSIYYLGKCLNIDKFKNSVFSFEFRKIIHFD